MSYSPIIHTINNRNIFIVLIQFIKTWYEIDLLQTEEINFGDRLGINISENINKVLNLFSDLNNSIIYGNKKYIHSAFDYIFTNQRLIISYNKKDDFLLLLQEGQQDFFYGIKKIDLLKENPTIYRFIINSKTQEITYYEDLCLSNFLIKHICTNCSKIKTKSYMYLFPKNHDAIKNKIAELINYFNFKTSFDKITILEKNDAIAFIDYTEHDYSSEFYSLTINKWEEKQKDITEKIVEIFEWKGWSDNTNRFKL
ncbi:hypothetical protein SOM12_01180 [Flavobacterium sp. CFBP9031]|uniref:hypothetical protein n=1 Tax=Flavobacterium sp. CFBP9031 TaxID=3096538 RepID=UPI002A6B75B9|nr:hypothetical protein [Flavobacterium sp. CFBP9031]MDY0986012.1 hypothetical protein [Flavobacterium sp. CFBP9031]